MTRDRRGKGNVFLIVGNLRITYVSAASREEEKDWAGADVIRIQAYRGDPRHNQSLHRPAEFPVPEDVDFLEFIATLIRLYLENRPRPRSRRR